MSMIRAVPFITSASQVPPVSLGPTIGLDVTCTGPRRTYHRGLLGPCQTA